MKEIKKDIDGNFICQECNKKINGEAWFGRHIATHGTKEEYFNKWLKEKEDGHCLHSIVKSYC